MSKRDILQISWHDFPGLLLTLYKLCAVKIRHINSTSEDVKYKWVDHQGLIQEILRKIYFQWINHDSYWYIQQNQLAAYDMLQNQLNMKYQKKFLVSNICHNEFIIYIKNFAIHYINILVRFPIKKYK